LTRPAVWSRAAILDDAAKAPLTVRDLRRCRHVTKTHSVSVDEHAGTSLQAKSYRDEDENVDLIIVSDGASTIVAVPKAAARQGLGAGDLDCLAKCIKIDDLEARLNCILACPASTGFEIFVRAEQRL
jgi:hypothetical protein